MNQEWMYEQHTEGYGVKWKISDVLYTEQTKYQQLSVVNTLEWGRTLVLDGNVQTTEKDEYIYHEMIVHPVMNTHPHPNDILIIGGGDGGVLKELLKYQQVQQVDMVEIDERVIAASKAFFPGLSSGFKDPRAHVLIEDGINYAKTCQRQYDLVIVDSSDPIGPAIGLYSQDFYSHLYNLLREDGILVVQSESPLFYQDVFQSVYRNISSLFENSFVYLASIPTYVSGPWSFMMGSKKYSPIEINSDIKPLPGLQYYNKDIHHASFCLPEYIRRLLQK